MLKDKKQNSFKLTRSYAYEILKFEASSNDDSFSIEWSGKVTAMNCFIPILVIEMELFRKFMRLILTSISKPSFFVTRIKSKGSRTFVSGPVFPS